MIIDILTMILFLIFVLLGSVHLYWLFGGTWALDKVLPLRDNTTENAIHPPTLATLFVALVLFGFGGLYLDKLGVVTIPFPNGIQAYAYWFIPILFILRAIGEFKYLGLFKRIKNTAFAEADSKVFIPLCLYIGITGLLVHLWGG